MPELPEVEICRRLLERWTRDRALVNVRLLDPAAVRSSLSTKPSDADPDAAACLLALRGPFGSVVRHGKRAAFTVGDQAVWLHLGMTGQFKRTAEQPRFARVGLELDDGTILWFCDMRRFGCLTLRPGFAGLDAGHGPDALLEPITGELLSERLRGGRSVKVALMDQQVLTGLGNIHAVEVLYKAGVSPKRRCDSLTAEEHARIARTIRPHLEWVLQTEGDTELVYVTEGGENIFSVYARAGEPCGICGTAIESAKMSGRSTFWCPGCQPA